MTFISGVGGAIGPIVVAFTFAALLALGLTPLVRRVVLRYEIVDRPEARRINTVPVPRGGGLAVCAAFLFVAGLFLALNQGAAFVPVPFSLQPSEVAALLLGGAVAAGLGARVVSGGTDNHLLLVDVTPLGVTGKEAEHLLDEIGITVNKNAIPFDTLPPNTASGIRIGTPAATSRGFGPDEMRLVGRIIIEAIRNRDEPAEQSRLAAEVLEIVNRFPVPGLPAA